MSGCLLSDDSWPAPPAPQATAAHRKHVEETAAAAAAGIGAGAGAGRSPSGGERSLATDGPRRTSLSNVVMTLPGKMDHATVAAFQVGEGACCGVMFMASTSCWCPCKRHSDGCRFCYEFPTLPYSAVMLDIRSRPCAWCRLWVRTTQPQNCMPSLQWRAMLPLPSAFVGDTPLACTLLLFVLFAKGFTNANVPAPPTGGVSPSVGWSLGGQ